MSVTPSFPGIYIQELPSNSHAITPAPTSIAAFVGYSHPFKTKSFDQAIQLFSFADYETYFGGLFSSGLLDAALPRAVFQFFLNGGSTAYVVGLQPHVVTSTPATLGWGAGGVQFQGSTTDATGVTFTALEPADTTPMQVVVTNVRNAGATYDVVITYGSRIETFRGLSMGVAQGAAGSADKVLNGVSALVTAAPKSGSSYGAAITAQSITLAYDASAVLTGFVQADFVPSAGGGPFDVNSSLDNVEIFNLLVVPGVCDNLILSTAMAFAERKRAFAIVDPPPQAPAFGIAPPATIKDWVDGNGVAALPQSQNAALYFPYLNSTDPVTGEVIPMAPSGFVAGIYARTDAARGVWKAPAGLASNVLNTTGPVASGVMNDPQNGILNLDSINCLRRFTGLGTVVWGSRTTVAANTAFGQSKYVPVRRMTLFIEQTLVANLKWVVFEPNDEPLWAAIRSSIDAFMLSLFRQGALQGSTPSEAFQVRCDASTTTSANQQDGIVNIVVAFAPLKPAEFVIIQIAQLAGQTAS